MTVTTKSAEEAQEKLNEAEQEYIIHELINIGDKLQSLRNRFSHLEFQEHLISQALHNIRFFINIDERLSRNIRRKIMEKQNPDVNVTPFCNISIGKN